MNEEWAESLDKFGYQIAASKKKKSISNIISQEKESSTHLSPFPKANTQVSDIFVKLQPLPDPSAVFIIL